MRRFWIICNQEETYVSASTFITVLVNSVLVATIPKVMTATNHTDTTLEFRKADPFSCF